MTHRNLLGGNILDHVQIGAGLRFQFVEQVNADNMALDPESPPLIFLNPAGAVDLLMPASTAARKGLTFIICNLSASAITLKTSGDAAFATAIAIAAGVATIVVCTGSSTANLGWRALALA